MPSFNDSIVVPFGLSGLASSGAIAGVLAYADGQYLPAMSAMPVSQHAFFATHSRNGKYVAVLCPALSATQTPPHVSFANSAYRVTVYDTDSWQLVHTIDAPPSGGLPNAMVVSNTGVVALAAGNDGVRVVDAVTQTELAVLTFAGPPVTYMGDPRMPVLEFSPDGAYLFVARISFGIATFSTTDWTRDTNMVLDASFYDQVNQGDTGFMQSPTNGVKFSPAGDAVYFYGPEHGLRGKSWPALTPLTLPPLSAADTLTDLGFSANGQTLYYVGKSDASGIATLYGLDLSDVGSQPAVVASTASGTFRASVNIGLSLSADGSKAALMGYAPDSEIDRAYGGAEQALKLVVVDTATGATQKSQTWTSRGSFGNGMSRFAMWMPLAKLQDVTGIIKDETGAGVARTVVLQPREKDSLMQPFWTESDATGRFRVPVAAAGQVLSRIAFDTTGTFNDLIDKVQV